MKLTAWLFAFFAFVGIRFVFGQSPNTRPNIIYIMADDLGYGDLSCYGRKEYQTPNLDKLAAQGITFTNAYAAAAVCTPTRTALMTGLYPARTPVGLYEPLGWRNPDSLQGLAPEKPSLAARLQQAGYETWLVGKWHLGFIPTFSPVRNGFDYFFGFKGGGVDYVSHKGPRRWGPDLYENDQPVVVEGYMTDILTTKALELIQRPHSKPFFLSLQFNAPHWPWQAPDAKAYPDTLGWLNGGSPTIFAHMMRSLDNAVGLILKALDEQKLAENTLVIFTSDNGGEQFSDVGIYKGRKGQLWEGGIRVPAFVRWPGVIKAGSRTAQVAITMDWSATVLALAGAADPSLDGIDLMPVMTGQSQETDRTLYWRTFQRVRQKAIRSGKWKYVQDEKGVDYLFNLTADPSETTNLREKEPQVYSDLLTKYQQWEKAVLPPIALK